MVKIDQKKLVFVLIAVIVILLGVIGYVFLINPALNGLVIQGYYQGISDIVSQVNTNGYVQIPLSENQSIILVPYQQPTEDTLSG